MIFFLLGLVIGSICSMIMMAILISGKNREAIFDEMQI
jgi:hypothetical protein